MTILKRILPLLITAVTLAGFTSCDDDEDDPYTSPLVGGWELDDPYYPNRFIFYADGTGTYEGYNEWNQWDGWAITWQSWDRQQLSVWFPQSGDQWDYYYRFQGGCLVLTDMYTDEELWYYRM